MLCKITMVSDHEINLPFSYNSIVQAVLYSCIDNKVYDKGTGDRTYKLLSFSSISNKPVFIDKEHKRFVFPNEIGFYVSSIDNSFFDFLMKSKTDETEGLNLGGNKVSIARVDVIKQETFSGGTVKALSPITVYSTFEKPDGGKVVHYYSPYDSEFEELIRKNLINKYKSYYGEEPEDANFTIKPEGRIIEKMITFKGLLVRGYSGMFNISGSPELINMGFCAGLGSKSSQGFGLIIRPDNKGKKRQTQTQPKDKKNRNCNVEIHI